MATSKKLQEKPLEGQFNSQDILRCVWPPKESLSSTWNTQCLESLGQKDHTQTYKPEMISKAEQGRHWTSQDTSKYQTPRKRGKNLRAGVLTSNDASKNQTRRKWGRNLLNRLQLVPTQTPIHYLGKCDDQKKGTDCLSKVLTKRFKSKASTTLKIWRNLNI